MDVLLYSKYSNSSSKLLSQLETTPDILENFNLVCIDNKKIRNQILSDEKIKVNVLPCLIRLNETTHNFDIFEGQNAIDFFSSLQQNLYNLKKQEELQKQHQELELQKQRQELELQKQRQELELQKQRQDLELQKRDVKKVKEVKEVKEPLNYTPIDDLDEKIVINTYTHVERNENSEISERDIGSKKAETNVKGQTILSKAMQMQKERV